MWPKLVNGRPVVCSDEHAALWIALWRQAKVTQNAAESDESRHSCRPVRAGDAPEGS